ncbi:MAG: DUF4835 family protein [Flammeovirgaceae bacterium]|nr:DUF4835 family protein [Flammeovirgaceae bacterium]MDW8287099.1 DUF4835 family protein [Flammeovirgaceae bacterium]
MFYKTDMKIASFSCFLVGFVGVVFLRIYALEAQELSCQVIVNAERVQSQEKQVFTTLQQTIQQFVNSQKWTNDEFLKEERIKCNILLNLDKNTNLGENFYHADTQIQSLRPVYGTDYETPVFSFFDLESGDKGKWQFVYSPAEPLIFSENTYTTELTSLLAYFSYLIIGMDYDTFAEMGGTPYYERALNILNNTQASGTSPGWRDNDVRDRYWLVKSLLDPQFVPFRQALYQYHRKGLDIFAKKPDEARIEILSALEKILQVRKLQPLSVIINTFFVTKADELVHIFSQGDVQVRTQAAAILSEADVKNANRYRKMVK